MLDSNDQPRIVGISVTVQFEAGEEYTSWGDGDDFFHHVLYETRRQGLSPSRAMLELAEAGAKTGDVQAIMERLRNEREAVGREEEDCEPIDPRIVDSMFRGCLFETGEDTSGHVRAEGITLKVGFHPGRLESCKPLLRGMLRQLPDKFKASGGDGASFLELCMDKNGNLWAGDHCTAEQLLLLGIAAGYAEYCCSRELWSALPGGMPYLRVIGI